jgi:hypothetical protein
MSAYLESHRDFSDIQDARPRPLAELEEQTLDAVR